MLFTHGMITKDTFIVGSIVVLRLMGDHITFTRATTRYEGEHKASPLPWTNGIAWVADSWATTRDIVSPGDRALLQWTNGLACMEVLSSESGWG